MNKKYEQLIEDVSSPTDEISFISKSCISSKFTEFYINSVDKFSFIKSKYVIKDSQDNDIYVFEINNFTKNGYIMNLNNGDTYNIEFKRSNGHGNDIIISNSKIFNDKKGITINQTTSLDKLRYSIKYFNQITRKIDNLKITCDFSHELCCIYFSNPFNNDILISKIKRPKLLKFNFILEIAPNVDYMLIYIIAIYLI
ncbi:hypothetical protein BCR32DRAFT_277808 [Anaeromyces robustus]|uniref:Tubby C-terminal domain-containing protein n=1 Tax=Anaeromyces robustus TaxID=1754192 RepID=A0A1Y1XDB9_9FUNG|nr:hypothetical protein BCR32DRAFT_277808 [Anaeromyces robustus]|eukprot:ORX83725.1 hypothetical protein BCR32DRAFT_277808 [Anaeromyces robustus]